MEYQRNFRTSTTAIYGDYDEEEEGERKYDKPSTSAFAMEKSVQLQMLGRLSLQEQLSDDDDEAYEGGRLQSRQKFS